jgi:SAM-dependent methyltransferase
LPDAAQAGLEAAIRAYWDERIHDIELSKDPRGTAAFYAALDRYRLGKCSYLLQAVDFGGWPGRDVLEMGCGAGLDLVRFARAGARVTGVDVAPRALDLARDYCRIAGVTATLLEADAARLPMADDCFDLVYCHGVLPFAANPAGLITEAHRVLRPGGTAIFMAYNRRSWMRLATKLFRLPPGHGDAPGFRLYDHDELANLLSIFAETVITAEKLPIASGRGEGITGRIFSWLRPYGWHLLARCRKGK